MRIVVVVLAALALIAGLSGEAGARAHAKKRHKHAKAHVEQPYSGAATLKPDAYVERDANKMRFGSALWWDQMLRENRAGQCCN